MRYDVAIIGGGIAGLVCARLLSASGLKIVVIEQKSYPFHRVCGEYVSNEVAPYLKLIGCFPSQFSPPQINKLRLGSRSGKVIDIPLDSGGFGISRYNFDHFLSEKAKSSGTELLTGIKVTSVKYNYDQFKLELAGNKEIEANMVIGAFGKRSLIDRNLDRKFFQNHSNYLAVKYHIHTDFPDDTIGLFAFEKGYCGISRIEDNKYCLCYLSHKENLKKYGSINNMEQELLAGNKMLEAIFNNSRFLFKKPEVISEISFEKKSLVNDHILMTGDAAGMITPLCGNGMAMAIRTADLIAGLVIQYFLNEISRKELEIVYERKWKKAFGKRLSVGKKLQAMFNLPLVTELTMLSLNHIKPLRKVLIRETHGDELNTVMAG